eukprot:CAMPEP_0168420112 /NCGR_PEP_ID=MMETSP0228-20121227/32608_1 /TAXON_ID=133427 /ORGANISM="Protoceratium reticulatum, Strain CCCM 535 (=CCMP 1889)" /LENGTH=482 /DNA_ID=CAMNT_0008433999 /DNA_START=14 /DNA_END=1462 /DNA_ORIENTATION=+
MNLLGILFTSVRAVGTMAVLAGGGIFMKKKGIMTPQVSKGLSEISMSLTIPCLLFTTAIKCDGKKGEPCASLAEHLQQGWPMLVAPIFFVGIALPIGKLAARLGGAEENFQRTVTAATAFGNSTGLPITLLGVVYDAMKDTDIGKTNPLVFLSVYLVLYPVLQWTIGSWLLQPKALDEEPEAPAGGSPRVSEPRRASMRQRSSSTNLSFASSRHPSIIFQREPPIESLNADGTVSRQVSPQIGSRQGSVVSVELPSSPHLDGRRTSALAGEAPTGLTTVRSGAALTEPMDVPLTVPEHGAEVLVALTRVFPPPVIGAISGMVVALIPPLRGVLVDLSNDGNAPLLGFVFTGMSKIGAAAVPINMLILGSSLAKGVNNSTVGFRTVVACVVAKMVVLPVFGLLVGLLLKFCNTYTGPGSTSFYLVIMLVAATPTANNLIVMAELAGENKEGLATCIFYQYMACPVLLTFWLAIYVSVAQMEVN